MADTFSVGVAKRDSFVDVTLLEHAIREDLNATSPRLMGVLRPLRVVIENYPEDAEESFDLALNPGDEAAGSRAVPFCRELFVDQEDFMEVPAPKFWRIFPGNEVRLRGACLLTVNSVVKNEAGEVVELLCRSRWPLGEPAATFAEWDTTRGDAVAAASAMHPAGT